MPGRHLSLVGLLFPLIFPQINMSLNSRTIFECEAKEKIFLRIKNYTEIFMRREHSSLKFGSVGGRTWFTQKLPFLFSLWLFHSMKIHSTCTKLPSSWKLSVHTWMYLVGIVTDLGVPYYPEDQKYPTGFPETGSTKSPAIADLSCQSELRAKTWNQDSREVWFFVYSAVLSKKKT